MSIYSGVEFFCTSVLVFMYATVFIINTHHSSEGSRFCCTAGRRLLCKSSAPGLLSSAIPAGRSEDQESVGSSSSCKTWWVCRENLTPLPIPEATAPLILPPAEPSLLCNWLSECAFSFMDVLKFGPAF